MESEFCRDTSTSTPHVANEIEFENSMKIRETESAKSYEDCSDGCPYKKNPGNIYHHSDSSIPKDQAKPKHYKRFPNKGKRNTAKKFKCYRIIEKEHFCCFVFRLTEFIFCLICLIIALVMTFMDIFFYSTYLRPLFISVSFGFGIICMFDLCGYTMVRVIPCKYTWILFCTLAYLMFITTAGLALTPTHMFWSEALILCITIVTSLIFLIDLIYNICHDRTEESSLPCYKTLGFLPGQQHKQIYNSNKPEKHPTRKVKNYDSDSSHRTGFIARSRSKRNKPSPFVYRPRTEVKKPIDDERLNYPYLKSEFQGSQRYFQGCYENHQTTSYNPEKLTNLNSDVELIPNKYEKCYENPQSKCYNHKPFLNLTNYTKKPPKYEKCYDNPENPCYKAYSATKYNEGSPKKYEKCYENPANPCYKPYITSKFNEESPKVYEKCYENPQSTCYNPERVKKYSEISPKMHESYMSVPNSSKTSYKPIVEKDTFLDHPYEHVCYKPNKNQVYFKEKEPQQNNFFNKKDESPFVKISPYEDQNSIFMSKSESQKICSNTLSECADDCFLERQNSSAVHSVKDDYFFEKTITTQVSDIMTHPLCTNEMCLKKKICTCSLVSPKKKKNTEEKTSSKSVKYSSRSKYL